MIKQWGQQMAEACCREGVLKEKNREAIAFGFEELIFVLINLVVIATIAAFTQELLNALIFCVIYLSLVRLVGIYHAKTRKGCFIKTMIVFVAYLLIMRGVPSDYYVIGSLGSFLFYLITAWSLTPVMHIDKPLTEEQKALNRKKALIYSMVFVAIGGMFFMVGWWQQLFAMAVTLDMVALMAIFGYLFNERAPIEA